MIGSNILFFWDGMK
jgi:hypothetical protein